MKGVFISLMLVLFCLSSYSQTVLDTDGLNNPDNVFLYSLKEYCKTLDSTKTKTVYVKKDLFIGDSWPKTIDSFKIVYLYTHREYKKAIRENKGNITVVGINPLNIKEGKFYVSVARFNTTYSWWKNTLSMVNLGGSLVYFNYSAEKKGLIYSEEQLHKI